MENVRYLERRPRYLHTRHFSDLASKQARSSKKAPQQTSMPAATETRTFCLAKSKSEGADKIERSRPVPTNRKPRGSRDERLIGCLSTVWWLMFPLLVFPAQGSGPSNHREMIRSTFGRSQANDQVYDRTEHTSYHHTIPVLVLQELFPRPPRHATLRYDHESLRYQMEMKDEATHHRERSRMWRQLRGTRL